MAQPSINPSLPPISSGATRISQTLDIPVNQEIRVQKREITVPQFEVVENVTRVEKIKEIVRVVEKKVLVDDVRIVDQVYHPREFRDIEVHVPVFEYVDNPIQRTIVRYFTKNPDTQAPEVAAVEKKNAEGNTLIKPNLKTYTVTIPVVNYRPIRKERVFVPHREIPGKIVYRYIDAKTKQELHLRPDDLIHQETKEPVIRQLNNFVPSNKVKTYYEKPVPQPIPGPIQDLFVDDAAQILDPEVRQAFEEWTANGKQGAVKLRRVEYEIEYVDVPTVVEGAVTHVVPDTVYQINTKTYTSPVEKIEWVDVEDNEADKLGLPKTERARIVAHAGDVIILNPVPGQVTVRELPTIEEQGPARYVIKEQLQKGPTKIEKTSVYFMCDEDAAETNLKVLSASKNIRMYDGSPVGALSPEEFENEIATMQAAVDHQNQMKIEAAQVAAHVAAAAQITESQIAYPLSHMAPTDPNFAALSGPAGQQLFPPPHFVNPAGQSAQMMGPNGSLNDLVRLGADGLPMAFTITTDNQVQYVNIN